MDLTRDAELWEEFPDPQVGFVMEANVVTHVGEPGLLGLQTRYDGECLLHAVMGGMLLPTEGVENECVYALEILPLVVWYLGAIGDVGEIADAEGEDGSFAMEDTDGSNWRLSNVEGLARIDGHEIHLWRARITMHEDVIVALLQLAGQEGVGIGRKWLLVAIGTQIVDAETMVKVIVGEEQGIDVANVGSNRLKAEIRAAIHQDLLLVIRLDHGAATKSVVVGIRRIANGTGASGQRHATGGACSEEGQFHRMFTSGSMVMPNLDWTVRMTCSQSCTMSCGVA